MFGESVRVRGRKLTAGAAVMACVLAGMVGLSLASAASSSAGTPVAQATSNDVTADALPTVQIDSGVVWTQVISGNTVYAGGNFSNARPAGSAAGTNLTARGNLLAYDITTGNLNTSFAPTLNGQVNALAVSPDGTTLYVGGNFTTAGTVGGATYNRYRIAAYNLATGQVSTTFKPSFDAGVYSIVATNSAVYVGGNFSQANGVSRTRLAAFSPADGSLLAWAPTADAQVHTMVMSPDGTHLIAGGSFANVNGVTAQGLASLDANTGALLPWAAGNTFKDYGANGSIMDLTTDGTMIYGTGYAWTSPSNFEGVFAADPTTGAITWLADCHGDGYGVYPSTDAVYVVSHEHDCSNIGGFPNYSQPYQWYRTTAFTKQVTGVAGHDSSIGYANYAGLPSPSLVNWFPTLNAGTFTGQDQAAWDVTGNGQYVIEGGEFPTVNGTAQYGLVRFAVPSIAPDKQGPMVDGTTDDPVITPLSDTAAQLAWQANWDRDDANLTYSVYRQDVSLSTPIFQRVVNSQVWNRPMTGYLDTGLTPGQTYTYWIRATDAAGNVQRSDNVTITMPTSLADLKSGTYSKAVLADGATNYWRLDQASGSASTYDLVSGNNLTLKSGVVGGTAGPMNDGDSASSFPGSSSTGYAYSTVPSISSTTFSEEAWFSSTGTTGGLLSFGSASTGGSSRYDHYIGLSGGKVVFRLYNGSFAATTITSANTYNDGAYHYVAATYSPSTGMALYVDGQLVGSNTTVATVGNFTGYWRIGGDPNYFTGAIDDAAVYPSVLTATQIQAHYAASGYHTPLNDTATAFTYTGTWTHSSNRNDGDFANDVHYATAISTAQKPVTATFTFSGTDAVVYGETGPSQGNDGVTVDGVAQANINTQSTKLTAQVPLVTVSGLTNGTHTITLSHLSGTYITIDKATSWVTPPSPPTASFTTAPTNLSVAVDGSGSTAAQGTITGYSWNWGDNTAAGSGVTATHTYAAAGTYTITLTVSASNGTTATSTQTVSVSPPNQPPVAVIATPSCTNLACSFDGRGSSDPDGTVTGYAWNFGDGSTGSGATVSHSFGTAGTYTVTLTVTDNSGASTSTTTSVTVAGPAVYAVDSFNRTQTASWGTADVGGAWTTSGGNSLFAVSGGTGTMNMNGPGAGPTAMLNAVSATDQVITFNSSINAVTTGNGVSVVIMARHTSAGDYRLKLRYLPGGVVHLALSKMVGTTETVFKEVNIPAVTYAAGTVLTVQFTLSGSNLSGSVWTAGGTAPATPQLTLSDTTFTGAGSIGIQSYLAGNSTVSPILATYSAFSDNGQ